MFNATLSSGCTSSSDDLFTVTIMKIRVHRTLYCAQRVVRIQRSLSPSPFNEGPEFLGAESQGFTRPSLVVYLKEVFMELF